MIKPELIKDLYKKFPQPEQNRGSLNFELLSNGNINHHTLQITELDLIINSVDTNSPFHQIPLRNISGIEDLENHIAIILRNSILFLNKQNNDIHVHIRVEKPSLWQRIKYGLSRK